MGEIILSIITVVVAVIVYCLLFCILVPISLGLKKLAGMIWGFALGILKKIFYFLDLLLKLIFKPVKKRLEPVYNALEFRLGASILLSFGVFVVLLIMGRSWSQLGTLFLDNTSIGSIISLVEHRNLFAASTVVSVGISIYVSDRFFSVFEEENEIPIYWEIGLVLVKFLFSVAIAVVLSKPCAAIAEWGTYAINSLSDYRSETSVALGFLKVILLILLRIVSIGLIIFTAHNFLSIVSNLIMGSLVCAIIALILECFGYDVLSSSSDLPWFAYVVIIEICGVWSECIFQFVAMLMSGLPLIGDAIGGLIDAVDDLKNIE